MLERPYHVLTKKQRAGGAGFYWAQQDLGKTKALSLLAGEKYEIVSCDSRQVYTGLGIATASPEPELQKRLRHHLLAILPPQESFTAGQFTKLATQAIQDIHKRGKRAVLSGGAGFYFRALKNGMFPVETPPEIRQKPSRNVCPQTSPAFKRIRPSGASY